jgi:hypothetical protein
MNTLEAGKILSTKTVYEIRKSSDPEGPAVKKFAGENGWSKAFDYVHYTLCDNSKPLGEYDQPSEYILVEVTTTAKINKLY